MEKRASRRIPNVLSLAGVDPSGGAGLLADIKTISALGAYACGVVTALTAQNTREVSGIQDVPPDFIRLQMETLFSDVAIDAVKIGMLSRTETILAVAQELQKFSPHHIVLDPVMVAKSGACLLSKSAVQALRTEMLPLCSVVTPNLPEAMVLLGEQGAPEAKDMPEMAGRLWELCGRKALVYLKGGHLDGSQVIDVVFDGVEMRRFEGGRICTKNTHGTGCALSSALAALLPQSDSPWAAARKAHDYLREAIAHSGNISVGEGYGPVDHFWSFR